MLEFNKRIGVGEFYKKFGEYVVRDFTGDEYVVFLRVKHAMTEEYVAEWLFEKGIHLSLSEFMAMCSDLEDYEDELVYDNGEESLTTVYERIIAGREQE